jgi:DNA-nicking Smr family endonuclease
VGRTTDPEDALFAAAVEGARPLAGRGRAAPARAAGRPQKISNQSAGLEIDPDGFVRAAGVSHRTARELGAGQPAPQATVDLHGETLASARERLERFLEASIGAGHRCVRVVTGKGQRSSGPERLRDEVPRWLATSFAPLLLAVAPAPPALGGVGAVLVLLRAPRRPDQPARGPR